MKPKIIILLVVSTLFLRFTSNAQEAIKPIKIGEKLPNTFLMEMVNYQSPSAKLSDFAGKALIIDFWATSCGACIAAFPKIDSLQRIHKSNLNVLLVTSQPKKEIQTFFQKKLWQPYKFPCAVNDTLLKRYFPHFYIPYQIWVDKNGIVRSINNGLYMTNEILNKFFLGEKLNIPDATTLADKSTTNGVAPIIIHDYKQYGLENLFSYGYVSKFQKDIMGIGSTIVDKETGTIRLSYKNFHWTTMLEFSLFNGVETFHKYSMIFRKDSRPLRNIGDYQVDDFSLDYFCYDGIVKDTSATNARELMHAQLDAAFQTRSYKEKRKIKVYILREYGTEHRYRNVENKADFDNNDNPNVKYSTGWLWHFVRVINSGPKLKYPLINEVPYKGKAYFQYDFSSKDKDPARLSKKLREFGLEIVEEERELNVLVIEDKK